MCFVKIGPNFVGLASFYLKRHKKNSSNDCGSWMVGEDDKGWDNGE